MEEIRNNEIFEEELKTEKKVKKSSGGFMAWLGEKLIRKTVGGLIGQIVILIAIPEAFLMICGLIFDKWLKLYDLTTVIFIVWIIILIIAIILIVLSIVGYVKAKKKA